MSRKTIGAALVLLGYSLPASAYEYVVSVGAGPNTFENVAGDDIGFTHDIDDADTGIVADFAFFYRDDAAIVLRYNGFGSFAIAETTTEVDVSSISLHVAPRLVLENGWSVFGNLGVHRWDVEAGDLTDSGNNTFFGAGISYEISEAFTTSIEMNRVKIDDGTLTQTLWTVGYRL